MYHQGKVHVLPVTPYLTYLHTKIRDKHADLSTFTHFSDQMIRQLLIKAAESLPYSDESVTTPIGDVYPGKVLSQGICGVSVIRAGESMAREFKQMFPEQPIGKILIQRNKVTKLPEYFYCHFPSTIAQQTVFLFFYCLFAAAYYLPGGLAALVMSIQPLIVMGLGAIFFRQKLSLTHILSAVVGVSGISLLVLNSTVELNWWGVLFGLIGTCSMALGILLTKHWGRPEGMSLLGFTGWQLTLGGLMLLPIALWYEDFPEVLTVLNIFGYAYLSLVGGVFGYFVWFRGIEKLNPVTTSFLGFLSSVSACLLGYLILGQSFTQLQLVGSIAIIASVYMARPQVPKQQSVPMNGPTTSSQR